MRNYRPGPGRPSKGARHVVTTRLPAEVDQLVVEEAAARDISKSELVAALVTRQLGLHADLPERRTPSEPLTLDTLSA